MFEFNGFTKKQAEILKQPKKRLNIYTGAVRSGKTVLTYFDIPELIAEFKGGRGILLGKTLGTVEENILKPMRDLYGDLVGDIKSDASGNRYVVIFGEKTRCVGANDKASEGKIRGATYSWAVCDEVSLYPENVFDMLMSRLSEPNAKCICTTNPDNPQHWFKVRFIDNQDIDCAVYNFTIEDNPILPKEYVENLKKIYSGTELYDRLILGLWVSGNGAIYKKFIAEESNFLAQKDLKDDFVAYNIGVDFGENTSATTFELVGLKRNFKGIRVLEEEVITEHGDPKLLQNQFVAFVKRCYSNGYLPKLALYDNEQATLGRGLESACLLAGLPIMVKPCKKDKIIERIHQFQTLMGAYMFEIERKCEKTIKAYKEAVWAENKEERLDIVSPTNPVDILDSVEYAAQPWIKDLMTVALYGDRK